jgi:hypothetical protein
LFTGPPKERSNDEWTVRQFLQQDGIKIVCGGTTAKIVAAVLNVPLEFADTKQDIFWYRIPGIDLAAEGRMTLHRFAEGFTDSIVLRQLHQYFDAAETVNVTLGTAVNPADTAETDIKSRSESIAVIAAQLRNAGKNVNIERV